MAGGILRPAGGSNASEIGTELDLMLDGGVEGKGSKDAIFAMIVLLVVLYAVVIVGAYVFFIHFDAEDEFYFFI